MAVKSGRTSRFVFLWSEGFQKLLVFAGPGGADSCNGQIIRDRQIPIVPAQQFFKVLLTFRTQNRIRQHRVLELNLKQAGPPL